MYIHRIYDSFILSVKCRAVTLIISGVVGGICNCKFLVAFGDLLTDCCLNLRFAPRRLIISAVRTKILPEI